MFILTSKNSQHLNLIIGGCAGTKPEQTQKIFVRIFRRYATHSAVITCRRLHRKKKKKEKQNNPTQHTLHTKLNEKKMKNYSTDVERVSACYASGTSAAESIGTHTDARLSGKLGQCLYVVLMLYIYI